MIKQIVLPISPCWYAEENLREPAGAPGSRGELAPGNPCLSHLVRCYLPGWPFLNGLGQHVGGFGKVQPFGLPRQAKAIVENLPDTVQSQCEQLIQPVRN